MEVIDFFKKTWKFLLGIAVTILGVFLISRRERTGEIIKKSTDSGLEAINSISESNLEARDKTLEAEKEHAAKLDEIKERFSKQEKSIKNEVKKKIEKALDSGDAEEATNLLSDVTGIKNID